MLYKNMKIVILIVSLIVMSIRCNTTNNSNEINEINALWGSINDEDENNVSYRFIVLCQLCRYDSETDKAFKEIEQIFNDLKKPTETEKQGDWRLVEDYYSALGRYVIKNGNNKMLLLYVSIYAGECASEETPWVIYHYASKYPQKFFALDNAGELLEEGGGIAFGVISLQDERLVSNAFRSYAGNKDAKNRDLALQYADKIDEIPKK